MIQIETIKNIAITKFGFYLLLTLFSIVTHGQNSGYVKSGDLNIHYRDYGQGTPIVLLSGGPGFTSNALLSIVEKLKDRYRLILIDQRGTGKSMLEKIDSSTITLDKYVEDINHVREFLGIDDWVVIGHSWGGGLAMALTAKYPEHTSKLIVIGAIGIDATFMKYAWNNLRYTPEDLDNLGYWSKPEVRAKKPERAAYEVYRSILPSRVYELSAQRKIMENFVFEPHSHEIAPLMYKHLDAIQYDLKPQLSKFRKPTLIIQGRQGFLGGWTAFTIYQTIPDCEIQFVEKCGHFPFIERPTEFFNILEVFLEK